MKDFAKKIPSNKSKRKTAATSLQSFSRERSMYPVSGSYVFVTRSWSLFSRGLTTEEEEEVEREGEGEGEGE